MPNQTVNEQSILSVAPEVRTTTSANYLTAQCLDYCVGTCDNCTRNQPAGNRRPGLVVEAIPECNLTY